MPRLTVEELLCKYKNENCSVKLKNNTWCLLKDGKVIYRITSKEKADKFIKEIYKLH